MQADLHGEYMQCMPSDTDITSTAHHSSTHQPQFRISRRICANLTGHLWPGRGSGPLDPPPASYAPVCNPWMTKLLETPNRETVITSRQSSKRMSAQ